MKRESYFLSGDKICLREPMLSDAESYHNWMNNPGVIRYLVRKPNPISIIEIEEKIRNANKDLDHISFAIDLIDPDSYIGNIEIKDIKWIHRIGEISIMIGDPDNWGKGYGTESILLASNYAFKILNLHKLMAVCYDENEIAKNAFKKVGFKEEGRKRKQCFYNGEYKDTIFMGILSDEIK